MKAAVLVSNQWLGAVLFMGAGSLCFWPGFSPALALLAGVIVTNTIGDAYPQFTARYTGLFLKASVVLLGLGIQVHTAWEAGSQAFPLTAVSILSTLIAGLLLAHWFKLPSRLGFLISGGTAICGGSAIAALAPAVEAGGGETSMALGVVFLLNALALLLFPFIGHALHLSAYQFGLWCAVAIHDTSSVTGAAAAFGKEALELATTVKLVRALWIIPLTIIAPLLQKRSLGRLRMPWFIPLFVLMIGLNSVLELPGFVLEGGAFLAHAGLKFSLFLTGLTLTRDRFVSLGFRPMLMGIVLWVAVSVASLCWIIR